MESITTADPVPILKTTLFGVQGMTCSACTRAIDDAVSVLPAVQNINIALLNNSMTVTYDSNGITAPQICSLMDDLGYDATEWETKIEGQETKLPSNEREVQLEIKGLGDGSSVDTVNQYLERLGLLSFTSLSSTINRTTVKYAPNPVLNIRSIMAGLPKPFTATVYHPPSLYSRSREIQLREARRMLRLFLASSVFAIPTFIFGVVGMLLLPPSHPFRQWCMGTGWWGGAQRAVFLLWIFATIVQFGIARIFFVHAWASLRFQRSWKTLIRFGNMDLLVALSTGVAYVASVVMLVIDIRSDPKMMAMDTEMRSYFDSCVFLTFFILAGRALESRARLKTGDAIALLGQLRPEKASILSDGLGSTMESGLTEDLKLHTSEEIPLDSLEMGDLILIRPGSIPPADGTIVEGTTTVDESSLTGESLPVAKGPGDSILTGTTILSSAVIVRVERLGEETALQQIVRAVGDSQNHKAPIEELADRITAVFVPVIVYLAVLSLGAWLTLALIPIIPDSYLPHGKTTADRVFFAFEFAIALLTVACPCGIGLAAPAAQAVGAGMAARAGILAQGGGTAFQLATQVDTVVFDKTGTLTQGAPEVVASRIYNRESWTLEAIRVIEDTSTHPLAAALVRYAEGKASKGEKSQLGRVKLVAMEEVAGKGTKGIIQLNGRSISFRLGNQSMVEGAQAPEDDREIAENWKRLGYSVVSLALSGQESTSDSLVLVAQFALSDPPRPEAAMTISTLQKAGKEVFMLSGDNEITARTVGRELGIDSDHVIAGVLPQEKATFIQSLRDRPVARGSRLGRKKKGKSTVLFAGDGLNDSAAVAGADVGVAFAHGSQVTLTSASFVLLQATSPLSSIPHLLDLSRRVYRRQKFNFGWAMVYNVILIPLAGGAFYPLHNTRIPPVWSALAMALSSVSVVMSSLALRWGL